MHPAGRPAFSYHLGKQVQTRGARNPPELLQSRETGDEIAGATKEKNVGLKADAAD